ncbi:MULTISPECIES: DUF308 domain-containing protein [unclassified Mesorhizobium]|uniref:DUF308 domain-containing protein n=1 Tax=unclassified Mesorhizobium TaxID=325217 RepID=UPI0003CEB2B8|nr:MULTISPECIES: DUF308 domain-containing protein [unclassified Mesorhizobium]ESX23694.1 membrane protein [Mesorhizobium sp. LSJC264A00]ESX48790.1 membrane protein [Mesorhizobium sp. LSHC426A00]ESX55578.1 membrane protein [Mesorhizobium sp. LSHC424B00]ESX72018.1 membrane protein [Mesorhizobium sp. LSHC416B00]ESY55377.1 membrane protein [Mesorhizobium sp. LNJC374B00]
MLAKTNEANQSSWLKSYYFIRFAVAAAWVLLAFTVASTMPSLAAIMLVAYPAWDALANFVDAQRSGGLSRNKTQLLNFVISIITTAAVAIALGKSMNAVLAVFGVWAVLSGLFQLATAVRRWKSGAQWAMVLSGAQSALAGIFFVKMAGSDATVGITDVAPYAAFGAFYFLVSAVWLTVSDARRKAAEAAG